MSTWKLVGLMAGWILTSIAIAVVTSILLTEFLVLVGLVDWATPQYAWAINGFAVVLFVGVVTVPFVFRGRWGEPTVEPTEE